ncbi:MAG: hypothetical protein FWC82_01670 [Firmicutes bacterium]|nr:hypothetical protein [Bacillota bacterium]
MVKNKVALTIDRILLFIVSAFFGIAVAGYFSRNTAVILLSGLLSAFCITALCAIFGQKKRDKNIEQKVQEVMMQFFLKGRAFAFETVLEALKTRYAVNIEKGFIIANRTAVAVKLLPEPLKFTELCRLYATRPNEIKRLLILTARGADNESKQVMGRLPDCKVTVLGGEKVYRLLQSLEQLPAVSIKLIEKKRDWKGFFVRALEPKNARRYLFVALLLLFSSIFMPASIFYLVVAAVCLALAILCRVDVVKRVRRTA